MWSNLAAFPGPDPTEGQAGYLGVLVISETGHSGGSVGNASGQGNGRLLMLLMLGGGGHAACFGHGGGHVAELWCISAESGMSNIRTGSGWQQVAHSVSCSRVTTLPPMLMRSTLFKRFLSRRLSLAC